jgi:hypothetical protein
MGARQREIPVSEFFTKNRHLLGFDNPRKALLTRVKGAVDNALDDVAVTVESLRATERRRRRSPADSADLRQAPLRFEVLPAAHEPRGGRSNKVYCVYIAPDEAMVREHAKQGGFPANRISEIRTVIDPTAAER